MVSFGKIIQMSGMELRHSWMVIGKRETWAVPLVGNGFFHYFRQTTYLIWKSITISRLNSGPNWSSANKVLSCFQWWSVRIFRPATLFLTLACFECWLRRMTDSRHWLAKWPRLTSYWVSAGQG